MSNEVLYQSELHTVALSLNIEGGKPFKALQQSGGDKTWYNLVVILDRPFVQQQTFDDIKRIAQDRGYPLKDSAIDGFSDAQANFAYLVVSTFLIDHVRRICSVSEEATARLTIQIHRRGAGKPHMELILGMLNAFYAASTITSEPFEETATEIYRTIIRLPDHGVEVVLCNGWEEKDLSGYEDSHLLFSIGMAMGLAEDLPSSSCVVPDAFIPFDEIESVLFCDRAYKVNNGLLEALEREGDLLCDERQHHVMQVVNGNAAFRSPDPSKVDFAKKMSIEEFRKGTILEALAKTNQPWSPNTFVPIFVTIQ